MRIFWRNKEGEKAPLNACFRLISFSNQQHLVFSDTVPELPQPYPLRLQSRTDSPSRSEWEKAVTDALRQIELGVLEKVVLARETTLTFHQTIDPFSFTSALQSKTKGATLFCVQIDENRAFAGVSPERLFQRTGSLLMTEAVAGTRRVGKIESHELLHSKKDLHEFQYVEEYLKKELSPFCLSPPSFSPISLHQTANVQHLFSKASATLRSSNDLLLLNTLHPTPAVCGVPKQAAYRYVQSVEPFERNWYSGVIGWSAPDCSEWVVAIRSCFIEKNTIKLYAGTGIVQGSRWDAEWDELEAKIGLYRDVCGL